MELFTVLLVAYMVKIAAEDTWHGIKGTPNPRHAARARRQRTRSRSRTWGALTNYWGDLVEDAAEAATERRRRKAEEKRKREEAAPAVVVPDEEIQDAEFWEDRDRNDPWKESTPYPDDKQQAQRNGSEATSPAAEPASNVYPFPNRNTEKENDMSTSTTEVQGLDQAIEYAKGIADSAGQHASAGNEGYIGYLQAHNVSGATLQSAYDMQEAFANAAAAAERHAVDLEEGKVVQEAYDQAPDAGDQEFATGGR